MSGIRQHSSCSEIYCFRGRSSRAPAIGPGLILAFAGGVLQFISFNDIGNAGEELKEANEILTE